VGVWTRPASGPAKRNTVQCAYKNIEPPAMMVLS
jgi:hypothetical protein